jgi:hypothetical protein
VPVTGVDLRGAVEPVIGPHPPLLGRLPGAVGGGGRVEPELGGLDRSGDPPVGQLVGERRHLRIHIRRRLRRQPESLGGDLAGLPRRHLPVHHPHPQPRQPVAELDRLPDIPPSGDLGDPERRSQLTDRELVHRKRPLAGEPQLPLPTEQRPVVLLTQLRLDRPHAERIRLIHPVGARERRHPTQLLRSSKVLTTPPLHHERQHRRVAQPEHLHVVLRRRR